MRGPFPERRTAKPTDVGPLVRNVPPPTSSTGGVGVFGRGSRGYPAEVSESGKRSLMQVQPTRLVELAAASETVLDAMRQDWADAAADLADACVGLGDASGAANLAAAYADSLADAGEVVSGLASALGLGISGLVDAAQDAVRADDTVAAELDRASHLLGEAPGVAPGRGGR